MARILLTTALFCLFVAGPVAAQELTCPEGNLLEGKRPSAQVGVKSARRMTDGVGTPEGDPWKSKLTSTFEDEDSYALYDLRSHAGISAIQLQADWNDEYVVEVSDDGKSFTELWVGGRADGRGLRRRLVGELNAEGRFVRLRARGGDGAYSVSEFQIFCEVPTAWPPPMKLEQTPSWWWTRIVQKRDDRTKLGLATLGLFFFIALLSARRRPRALYLATGLALSMLALASYRFYGARLALWFSSWGVYVLAAGVLVWLARGIWLSRTGKGAALWWERGALVCVIVSSSIAFVNFGSFHSSRVVHYWDMFHYYAGSKYFEENGYERLYECVLVADVERRGATDLRKRKIRSLVDNHLFYVTEEDVRGYAENCATHFSAERWAAFKADTEHFRSRMGSSWWKDMVMDHGYNASPVSNVVASFLSNLGWRELLPEDGSGLLSKAEREHMSIRIRRYAAIDLLLYAGSFLLIFWAFGLRACALAVLLWGTGYPWAYFWTGGSFARVPWFFMATAAVCLLRRGMPLLAGFAISWSALLRLFPAVMVGGQGASIVDRFFRRKRIDGPWLRRSDQRFILGGFLGLLVLIGGSVVVNGVDAHPQFIKNSLKHRETPLTNHMGLETILSYRPSKVGRHTKDPSLDDPWLTWKQGRKDAQHQLRWLYLAIIVGMFVLLALVGRQLSDWAVLAASVILIIAFFELTCYYYHFVVLLAPLALERLRYVVAMIGMVIVGHVFQFFVGWYDEQYIWETIVILVAILYILIDIVRKPLPADSMAVAH